MKKPIVLALLVALAIILSASSLADSPLFAFDSPAYTVAKDKSAKLKIIKDNISGEIAYTWTSSNEDIATVKNGTVKGISTGEVTIRCDARKKDGTVYSAECVVTVTQPIEKLTPAQKEYFFPQTTGIKIEVAESQEQADYFRDTLGWQWPVIIVEPANASIKDLEFTSSNKNVVLILDEDTFVVLKTGKTTITVKETDGSGKKCSFTVTVPELYTSQEKIEIAMGSKEEFCYQVIGTEDYSVNTTGTCFEYEEIESPWHDKRTHWEIKPVEVGEGCILFSKNGKKVKTVEVIVSDFDDNLGNEVT